MSRSYQIASYRESLSWRRLFGSAAGCHLLGGSLSLAILIAILFILLHKDVASKQLNQGDLVIDLDDAAKLVAEADNWQGMYTKTCLEAQEIDARVASIDNWLPRSADWQTRRDEIRSLAQSLDIKIVSLDEGDLHVGTRVGVAVVTCRLEGSYRSICQFLIAMGNSEKPIICSEIQLARLPVVTDKLTTGKLTTGKPTVENPAQESPCAATLSLRVPFAAQGSVAAQLLPAEMNDAS